MEVGSPEHGFDDISDLLKDDESTLPEDLNLSFIKNKDIAAGYVYDDLAGNDKFNFHFSEQGQSELPSLASNFGDYDIPGPCTENFHSSAQTGCHSDVLLDTHVIYDQNLPFESQENECHEVADKLSGGYHGDSTCQVDSESVDHKILNDVSTHLQEFVSVEDENLEVETAAMPKSPPHNELVEKTFQEALQEEVNHSQLQCKEEEDEVSVHQIQKLYFSPSLHCVDLKSKSKNVNDSRNSPDVNKELESSPIHQHDQGRTSRFSTSPVRILKKSVSPETSLCTHQLPDAHGHSTSHGLQDISDSKTSLDRIHQQAECFDQDGDTPLDHSLHAGMQNSSSSEGSLQRSQHIEGSPATHVATPPRNHRRVKRSRSHSPVREKNSSSRCKRDCYDNSEAKSPYSRECCKRSSQTTICFHQSPRSHYRSVSREGHKELSHCSRSRKHKHYMAGSSERSREVSFKEVSHSSRVRHHKHYLAGYSDRGKEAISEDHTLHSGSQNSAFRQESEQKFVNSSSRKYAHSSPRNNHSRHSHRKVGRSVSQSPVHQQDLSSGYQRDHNGSRSRSPFARDPNRQSPRLRYFPRNRSPARSYFPRHRSPVARHSSPAFYRRTGLGKPGTCLFVAGFGFLITERELERKFSRFGRVRDVRIIRDKRSGISRGYGFLSLESDEEADAAIRALHRTQWNGRILLVEKSISN